MLYTKGGLPSSLLDSYSVNALTQVLYFKKRQRRSAIGSRSVPPLLLFV